MDKLKKIIMDNLKDVISCEMISNTNNIVFKVITKEEILYAKVYNNKSSHIDHELNLYSLVDLKYLKELVLIINEPKIAIFKEVNGITIDELTDEQLLLYSKKIIDNLCNFFSQVSKQKNDGYGLLDENMKGNKSNFIDFIIQRQTDTSEELKDYSELSTIFKKIYDKYKDYLISDNALVPIDTNLKNIMILKDETIKFIDPGEVISGPILMGYGDFFAHTYKTPLSEELLLRLNLSEIDEKVLRIYAIFSSLNILSFLHKQGVKELEKVIPFGNKYTFYSLILEHLKYLELS